MWEAGAGALVIFAWNWHKQSFNYQLTYELIDHLILTLFWPEILQKLFFFTTVYVNVSVT